MNKIIITHTDEVSPVEAVEYASKVISDGKVSNSRGIKHYCWHTMFYSGFRVHVRLKSKETSSDSLHVEKVSAEELKEIIDQGAFKN